jgi:hypothetical protein
MCAWAARSGLRLFLDALHAYTVVFFVCLHDERTHSPTSSSASAVFTRGRKLTQCCYTAWRNSSPSYNQRPCRCAAAWPLVEYLYLAEC